MFVAIFVTLILLGGPLTVFFLIQFLNTKFGGIRAKLVQAGATAEAPLSLMVAWDERSFPHDVNRVRLEYVEMFPGGRSTSFSFTFEDKKAQKKSFLIPMKIDQHDLQMLTDGSVGASRRQLEKSILTVEIEYVNGEVKRDRINKKALIKDLKQATAIDSSVNAMPPTSPDSWSVYTRVFPWRKEVVAQAGEAKPKAKKAAGGAAQVFDFIITKVWIEPGCIVCDACENEAPDVFHVLADTCIVRENAPMVNTGSIVAAAEGCPVDVIKYSTAPKAS